MLAWFAVRSLRPLGAAALIAGLLAVSTGESREPEEDPPKQEQKHNDKGGGKHKDKKDGKHPGEDKPGGKKGDGNGKKGGGDGKKGGGGGKKGGGKGGKDAGDGPGKGKGDGPAQGKGHGKGKDHETPKDHEAGKGHDKGTDHERPKGAGGKGAPGKAAPHLSPAEVQLLRDAGLALAVADRDYAHHRANAMHQVQEALRHASGNSQLVAATEKEIAQARAAARHQRPVHEWQAISDGQLRFALQKLGSLQSALAGQPGGAGPHAAIRKHVDDAIQQINEALKVR